MRRIDVISIGIATFAGGGAIYLGMRWAGIDALDAGVWSQAILVLGLIGWLATYLYRAFTKTMTYNQQLQDYEDAVLQKRLDEMTPEELAALQAEIDQENQVASASPEPSDRSA
jgi:membrane protein implicated in regulation of membrane protease activity